jgi:hypothetical protein
MMTDWQPIETAKPYSSDRFLMLDESTGLIVCGQFFPNYDAEDGDPLYILEPDNSGYLFTPTHWMPLPPPPPKEDA